MTANDPHAAILERLSPGATLTRREPLTGGVSAAVELLEFTTRAGAPARVVLRRHGAAAWKPLADDVTATEFALLTALRRAGLPVPAPLLLDTSRELLPSPFLVLEFVEGRAGLPERPRAGALGEMAEFLARLHALELDALELPTLPRGDDPIAGALRFVPSADDALRDALTARAASRSPPASVLVHGDFWPGNILWRNGRVAAVVDWEDAALGDPLLDLACCRLELLWRGDEDDVETFTRRYLAARDVDTTELPIWELYAGLAASDSMGQWGLDAATLQTMRARTTEVLARARARALALPR
ncbi:MAG: phosphotransferase family protein [Myxococcales bacterium]|nr:phosphotransferase family protein [Myxococcales bacterium]